MISVLDIYVHVRKKATYFHRECHLPSCQTSKLCASRSLNSYAQMIAIVIVPMEINVISSPLWLLRPRPGC
jgi:hypothetical protein